MITIGVDAHKQVHHALALDATGQVLGTWRGANAPDSWQQLLRWATSWPGPRQWGIEGAWHYGAASRNASLHRVRRSTR